MLIYGSELLQATATASFWNGYENIPAVMDDLMWRRQSTQKTETYPRLGAAPMPEAWSGDRKVKDVNEYSYSLTNAPYDASVRVDKELIKYENIPAIAPLIANLGQKTRALQTSLATALLVANGTGDDGQNFFDTDHADPGAVYTTSQDNDLTGAAATGTQPTDLEFRTAVAACFDSLWSRKDDRGDPHIPQDENPANFIALVPPAYRTVAQQVARSDTLTGPVANDLQNTFTVRTNPFQASGAIFYFFYTGSAHKPVLLQETGNIEMTDDIDPHNGDTIYSATWWGAVGYGQWRTGVLYTFT